MNKLVDQVSHPFSLVVSNQALGLINGRHFSKGARARFFDPARWTSFYDMVNDETLFPLMANAISSKIESGDRLGPNGEARVTTNFGVPVGWACALPGNGDLPFGESYAQIREKDGPMIWRFTNEKLVAPRTNLAALTVRITTESNTGTKRTVVIVLKAYPGHEVPTWENTGQVNIPPKDWIFFHPDSPGQE